MDQQTWNALFSWITGRQCFLPEGCQPPMSGIILYALILIAIGVVSAIMIKKEDEIRERIDRWRK